MKLRPFLFFKMKCQHCGKQRQLTRHHITPFKTICLCRTCHDSVHHMGKKVKYNQKYQKGTKRMHKKK